MKMKRGFPIYILVMLGLLSIFVVSCGGDDDDSDTVTPPPPAGPEGMVLIPAGEFQMGSNEWDEKPVHTVYLDAFYMDKHEVTNAQYKEFIDANPEWGKDRIDSAFHPGGYLAEWNGNDYPDEKADHPITYVSWYAAVAYAKWASKRLPTEAEWAYAARGGLAGKKYPWGDVIDPGKAHYGQPFGDTTAVGKYPPNGYGLFDMAGNVWEWCLDEYNQDFYSISPRENPLSGANTVDWIINNFTNVKTRRVVRGGSWYDHDDTLVNLRVTKRFSDVPEYTISNYGFRCVRAQ